MDTFVRVVEVWRPSADGSLLELSDGLFESAPAFGAASRGMCFGRAEGLPGHAWNEARPILLPQLEGSYFRRAAAARAAGLSCAVALPVFRGELLTSLVVLLCGAPEAHRGAIELWHNDPRITGDLRLESGHFGAGAEALAELSRDSYLPRGSGLPGLAWQREAAVFIEGLGDSRQFLRAQSVAAAGVVNGLALPCASPLQQTWVLSLLSSRETPIARRVESWLPGDAPGTLQRGFGYCAQRGRLPGGAETTIEAAVLGCIGEAAGDGVARVSRAAERAGVGLAGELADAGLRSLVVIPLIADAAVSELVVLHF
ncbi:MAG: hypothetical protein QM722_13225 [Piscinibacter sp.]